MSNKSNLTPFKKLYQKLVDAIKGRQPHSFSVAAKQSTEKLESDIASLLEAQKIVTGETGNLKKDVNKLQRVILTICKEKKDAEEIEKSRTTQEGQK